jgi:phosphatidate cytidylyltransferase
MSGLARRVLTAAILLPPILAAIYAGPPATAGVLIVLAVLGSRELVRLLHARGLRASFLSVSVGAVFLIVWYAGYLPIDLPFALLVVALFLVLDQLFRPGGDMLLGLPSSLFGAFYLGFLPAHLLGFFDFDQGGAGPLPVYFALALVWASDTGAYGGGSLLGRHKLWPRVSPSKSWEGAVFGLLVPVVLAVLLGGWVGNLSIVERIVAGIFVGLFGQIGDLAESLMKREASTKDSGRSFPGHGGVLDRMDSLVLAVPVLYYWLRFAVRTP